MSAAVSAELAVSLVLTGLIWTIQVVHYPSFHYVDPLRFSSFAEFHQRRISVIVIPLMLLELGLTGFLTYSHAPGAGLRLTLTGLIWLSTFILSVPLHQQLLKRHEQELIRRLILTNWPRTILWTARSLLAISVYKT